MFRNKKKKVAQTFVKDNVTDAPEVEETENVMHLRVYTKQ